MARRPHRARGRSSVSDVALLRGLLVARVQHAVEDDRGQQDRGLDQVLIEQRNVEDGHRVQQDADQRRADQHVAHAALAARKPDAADHRHQHDVVKLGRVHHAGVHRLQAARGQDPGGEGDERRDHVTQHQHRPHRHADIARRRRVVARVIDIAPPFGEAQEDEGGKGETGEDEDLERHVGKPQRAELGHPVPGRHRHRVRADQLRTHQPVDEGGRGEGDEDRRHLGIGDKKAVREADRHHAGKGQTKRRAVAQAVAQHLQIPRHRHRHHRHHRQVDAAADHDDRHAEREDSQHRDRAHDRHQIVGGEEPRQGQRRDDEDCHRDREDDALLIEGSEKTHRQDLPVAAVLSRGGPIRSG
ncbi:hypothetical protein SDC9_34408 [bioreactor metagenome]|uniref:Uncharacterized protein n=1 Tax=bioreactor metagenome TaxID=1076179 RepID=A0A644VAP3_9ZZZZ